MWAHGFINKPETVWLVKIASHEQLTIELQHCTGLACQMASAQLKTECTHHFIHRTIHFCSTNPQFLPLE